MIRSDERLKTVHRTEDEDHLVFLNYARSNSSAGTRSAIRWQTWCASCLRAALTGDADPHKTTRALKRRRKKRRGTICEGWRPVKNGMPQIQEKRKCFGHCVRVGVPCKEARQPSRMAEHQKQKTQNVTSHSVRVGVPCKKGCHRTRGTKKDAGYCGRVGVP